MTSTQARYKIDGKGVYGFLFAHRVKLKNAREIPHMFQVEAFDLDHAWRRLREWKPMIPRRQIEFLSELEPEHDVGYLGEKLPMFPNGVLLTSLKSH